MKNIIRKKYSGTILLFVILCFFVSPSLTFAQNPTHIVQKGDTLWSICEEYYGDPNLWPKLWEMNPFITNPHLLKAGDVITLLEKEPVKEEVKEVKKPDAAVEKPPVKVDEIKKAEPVLMGVDISGLIEVDAIGYLSVDKIQAWGSIFSSDNKKILLGTGETVYVIFDESKDIKIGDQFFIGNSSPLLKHPVTGKDLGYTFNVNGILTIEERLGRAQKGDKSYEKKNVFKAEINESYKPVQSEDILIPYKPVSSCVLPIPVNKEMDANIVATKNQEGLIQPNSIVYIDLGSNDGLKRGNVLDVVKKNTVSDPKPDETFTIKKSKIILPDIFVGRIMIIECGAKISTAIVLSAVEPFSSGVYIKDLSWDKTPDFLSEISSCTIK